MSTEEHLQDGLKDNLKDGLKDARRASQLDTNAIVKNGMQRVTIQFDVFMKYVEAPFHTYIVLDVWHC
jgi:hypothetical protein